MTVEIPVGQDVQHRLVGPPRLQVERLVFGKSAIVEDAKFGACSRKLERVGLSAIVKAGPVKQPGKPGAVGVEAPSATYAVEYAVAAVGAAVERRHAAVVAVIEIYAASAAAGGLLRAERNARRVVAAMLFDRILHDVVVAGHVGGDNHCRAAACRETHRSRRVKAMAILAH